MLLPCILAALAAYLCFLVQERIRLERARRAVGLRIAVTGTRGKSTIVRLLAAALRANGRTVLAKTTGSAARLILPDGSERRILRRGPGSIIEQKRLLRAAARMGADTVIAEVMSIHAENHAVETGQLLRPHLVLISNFRVDHAAAQGGSPREVARVLLNDVWPGAQVLLPEAEYHAEFAAAVAARGAVLRVVGGLDTAALADAGQDPSEAALPENLGLVRAAAALLGLPPAAADRGIAAAPPDPGAARVWRRRLPGSDASALLVSAFAANDPHSTRRVFDLVLARHPEARGRVTGLLALRADRGERTLQWLDALAAEVLPGLERLCVCGEAAGAFRWRLVRRGWRPTRVAAHRRPEPAPLTRALLARRPTCIFGFGNYLGLGASLAAHWREGAEPTEP